MDSTQQKKSSFNLTDEEIDEVYTRALEETEEAVMDILEDDDRPAVCNFFSFTSEERNDKERMTAFKERLWVRFERWWGKVLMSQYTEEEQKILYLHLKAEFDPPKI
jgi:hypothetical protein